MNNQKELDSIYYSHLVITEKIQRLEKLVSPFTGKLYCPHCLNYCIKQRQRIEQQIKELQNEH